MTTDAKRKKRAEKRKARRAKKRAEKQQSNQNMVRPRAPNPPKRGPSLVNSVSTRPRFNVSGAFEGFDNVPLKAYGGTKDSYNEIDLIVACMALPDQAPSMRLAPGDTSRSAKGQTFERITAQWSPDAENDTLTAFTQRVAECSEIVETYNNTGQPNYGYNMKLIQDQPGFEDAPPAYNAQVVSTISRTALQWTVATVDTSFAFQPHSDTIFAGGVERSLGCFVWLEAGDSFTVPYTWENPGGGATGDLTVSLDRWTSIAGLQIDCESAEAIVSEAEPSGILSVPVSKAGYYAANWLFSVVGAEFLLGLNLSGINSKVWGHRYMPEYFKFSGSCTGIVQTGVAMMYSNRAAEGYRQGEIVAFQIPKGQHWMNFQEYDTVFSSEGSVPLNIKNGQYIPLKPSDTSELQFQTFTKVNVSGVITGCRWPVDGGRPVIVLSAKVSAGSEAAPNPRDGFWSFLYNFQFQTASKWFDKDFSTVSSPQVQAAIDRFRWLPTATENPKHFSSYLKSILKTGDHVLKGVEKYGPKVLRAANTGMQLASAFA